MFSDGKADWTVKQIRVLQSLLAAFLLVLPLAARAQEANSEHSFEFDGAMLNFAITGDGDPLYLLHGGMESRDSYNEMIPKLAEHFTVVALDSRGQGRSSNPDRKISYARMARDVEALAAHLGHTRIFLVGQSDGGITALTLSLTNRALIDRMVLLSANFNVDAFPAEQIDFLANYRWNDSRERSGFPGMFIDHYLKGYGDLDEFGAVLEVMIDMWTTSPNFTSNDISSIETPTLVVNGDHEDIPLPHAIKLHAALPNSQLFVVPGASHFINLEKPGLLNDVIIDFLLAQNADPEF